jgi:hypothetical protein
MNWLPPIFEWQSKVTQWFAETIIDYSKWGYKGHNGIDIACAVGTPVMSVAHAVLKYIGYEPDGYGHFMFTLLDDGREVIYAHLSEILVKTIGQEIQAGEVIAKSGNSGNTTGPHLHIGERPKGYNKNNGYGGYEDPKSLLVGESIIESTPDIIQTPVASTATKVKVVCTMANIRTSPGYGGSVIKQVHGGDEFDATGKSEEAGGLKWREIKVNAWIAERDYENTKIIEDV